MYRTFLSWRYLTSRRTNLIGIVGIFVAVGALILILAIMTGFLDESRRAIRGSLSDILITPAARLAHQVDAARTPDALLEVVESDPRVVAAAPHLRWFGVLEPQSFSGAGFEGLASSSLDDVPIVELVGIDVEREFAATEFRAALEREPKTGARVSDIDDPFALRRGPDTYRVLPKWYVPDGAELPFVVLGEQLMWRYNVQRGDVVNLAVVLPNAESGGLDLPDSAEGLEISNKKFVVAGSFRSRENEVDLARIYMDRRELNSLLNGPRDFSEVLVKLGDYEADAQAFKREISSELADRRLLYGLSFEVKTWEEFRGNLLGAIENERTLMAVMLSLVLIVAGFTVFAILSMMVTEKRRDIGILTALGATPRGVLFLFLMIGLWDALIGALAGAVAGIWMALKIDDIERWLSRTLDVEIFNRDVYLFDFIPSRVDPTAAAVIVAGAFFATLLFAAIPAWQASRLDPLDALRYE